MANKVDYGSVTEDDVQRFVEQAFSADFVFRSPQHEKGGKQKETTDVLAIYEDVAIAIQVKAQAYNADGLPREQDDSWTSKNLAKAVAQVRGSVRTLRASNAVRLVNTRRGELLFDHAKARYIYGLVVLNHNSAPFNAAELCPELEETDFPVHVLSFVDFINLHHFLDTPGDLVGYLEMRANILIPTLNPLVHEEKKAFEYYLDHLEELTEFLARSHGDDLTEEQVRPYAEAYRQIYRREHPDLEVSYFIDRIINRVHQVDETLEPPFGDGTRASRTEYAVFAESLASLVRPRRAYLGRKFYDTIDRAGKANDTKLAHASSKHRDECILFMASPHAREQRSERNKELRDLLWLLKATRQVSRALGIATEAGFGAGRSYDFILLEGSNDNVVARSDYAEIRGMGEKLFGTAMPA